MSPAPWERQPEETARPFEARAVYQNLGAERSLANAGKVLGKSPATLERWSVRWRWVECARAWDDHQAAAAARIAAERDETAHRLELEELNRRRRRLPEISFVAAEAAFDHLMLVVKAAPPGEPADPSAFAAFSRSFAALAGLALVGIDRDASRLGMLATATTTAGPDVQDDDRPELPEAERRRHHMAARAALLMYHRTLGEGEPGEVA